MTISKHIHALRAHLANLGLHPVPGANDGNTAEVFKVCFLNKYEMQRWKALQQEQDQQSITNHTTLQGHPEKDAH
ncbi:hypothetical protein [Chitinophaga sp. MM2321]|uniref:hypothetical protein n=1 Tax=Chitinophaga sp. MM2321 TaxID=3137178 RepID=UPI0032D592A2